MTILGTITSIVGIENKNDFNMTNEEIEEELEEYMDTEEKDKKENSKEQL